MKRDPSGHNKTSLCVKNEAFTSHFYNHLSMEEVKSLIAAWMELQEFTHHYTHQTQV